LEEATNDHKYVYKTETKTMIGQDKIKVARKISKVGQRFCKLLEHKFTPT